MLRGTPKSSVTIKASSPTGQIKNVQLTREEINAGKKKMFRPYHYVPPYRYSNFIVFGEGVEKKDMIWNKNRTRLVSKRTGDEITFSHPACYNLVYFGTR